MYDEAEIVEMKEHDGCSSENHQIKEQSRRIESEAEAIQIAMNRAKELAAKRKKKKKREQERRKIEAETDIVLVKMKEEAEAEITKKKEEQELQLQLRKRNQIMKLLHRQAVSISSLQTSSSETETTHKRNFRATSINSLQTVTEDNEDNAKLDRIRSPSAQKNKSSSRSKLIKKVFIMSQLLEGLSEIRDDFDDDNTSSFSGEQISRQKSKGKDKTKKKKRKEKKEKKKRSSNGGKKTDKKENKNDDNESVLLLQHFKKTREEQNEKKILKEEGEIKTKETNKRSPKDINDCRSISDKPNSRRKDKGVGEKKKQKQNKPSSDGGKKGSKSKVKKRVSTSSKSSISHCDLKLLLKEAIVDLHGGMKQQKMQPNVPDHISCTDSKEFSVVELANSLGTVSSTLSSRSKPGSWEFNREMTLKLQTHRKSLCIQDAPNYDEVVKSEVDDFVAAFNPNEMRCLALVSHNEMKTTMKEFVVKYKNVLKKFQLTGTNSTMKMLGEVFEGDDSVIFGPSCKSGPLGGDAELVAMMVTGQLGGIFFFQDPMTSHPHQADIECLVRQAIVHNTIIATTPTTAMTIMEPLRLALEGDGRPELIPSFFFTLASPTVEAYKIRQAKIVKSQSSPNLKALRMNR